MKPFTRRPDGLQRNGRVQERELPPQRQGCQLLLDGMIRAQDLNERPTSTEDGDHISPSAPNIFVVAYNSNARLDNDNDCCRLRSGVYHELRQSIHTLIESPIAQIPNDLL